jgi:sigma-E factor negative regulatory protein RseB
VRRALAALLIAGAGLAQAQTTPEALTMLRKVYQATEKLSYTGTFVYQQGERSETSRVTRLADASGQTERLEVLDGVPREIVRTRGEVKCYLPESKTVKVDRVAEQRSFPALLPERVTELARQYTITRGEGARIAGYDCESLVLTPRDELRYGYRLWFDRHSGMLLRARTFNERGETVEQYTFTQLSIGNVSRDKVRAKYAARSWRVEDSSVAPADLERSGWTMSAPLPGFRKVIEVTRQLGESRPVGQVVYSDGLAAVSVFIEPLAGRAEPPRPGLSKMGAIHIYTREVASHIVTVVGEAPAASVQRVAQTVEFRKPR